MNADGVLVGEKIALHYGTFHFGCKVENKWFRIIVCFCEKAGRSFICQPISLGVRRHRKFYGSGVKKEKKRKVRKPS